MRAHPPWCVSGWLIDGFGAGLTAGHLCRDAGKTMQMRAVPIVWTALESDSWSATVRGGT